MRKRISTLLIKLALKIYHANPAVIAYYEKLAMDLMISGIAIRRIEPCDFYLTPGE